jgi:hypothetical protein
LILTKRYRCHNCQSIACGVFFMSLLNKNIDLIGMIIAVLIYSSAILVFIARLCGKRQIEFISGIFELLLSIPLMYLLIRAHADSRPILYFIQVGLMLLWLVIELLLDYILKIDFRKTKWMVICYVTLFFGSTGGMLGVASNAGRVWRFLSIFLFLIMTILAFIQRKKTGR